MAKSVRIIPEATSRARLLAFLKKHRQNFDVLPGGSTTQIQFNSNGSFGADHDLVWDTADGDGLGIGLSETTKVPKVHLDVNYGYLDDLTADTGGGESVSFGSAGGASLTTGKIYFLKDDGVWTLTDADSKTTGGTQMLAIALAIAPATGMLLKGFFRASTALSSGWDEGKPVYLSTDPGLATTTAPSNTGDFVRIIGYCTAQTGVIYFNPSSTYVEIS